MNENMKLWIDALRSGKYEQTQGTLGRPAPRGGWPAGFCCLGVACEVAMQNGVELTRGLDDDGDYVYVEPDENAETAYLPPSVREWLGLRFGDVSYALGHRPASSEGTSAAVMNDSGAGFDKIADAIEENEKGKTGAS